VDGGGRHRRRRRFDTGGDVDYIIDVKLFPCLEATTGFTSKNARAYFGELSLPIPLGGRWCSGTGKYKHRPASVLY
jgi:hypothetical protein